MSRSTLSPVGGSRSAEVIGAGSFARLAARCGLAVSLCAAVWTAPAVAAATVVEDTDLSPPSAAASAGGGHCRPPRCPLPPR